MRLENRVPRKGDEGDQGPVRPNAYELRLLLAEDWCDKVELALDGFFEQEVTEIAVASGFSHKAWPFLLLHEQEKLKIGVEMQYSNHTDHDTRSRPVQLFEICPSLAFKLPAIPA